VEPTDAPLCGPFKMGLTSDVCSLANGNGSFYRGKQPREGRAKVSLERST